MLAHPVDGEAGGGGQTPAQDLLVGLDPPVAHRAGLLYRNETCREETSIYWSLNNIFCWGFEVGGGVLAAGGGQELVLLRSFFRVLTATLR